MNFFVEFKSAEVLLQFKSLCVVLDTIKLKVENVRWIFDPVFVDAHLVGAGFIVTGNLGPTNVLPVVKEPPVLYIEYHRPHLLDVLADELLLACLFVIQLCDGGIGAKEVFINRVCE